jgi:hypothetical protein
MNCVRRNCVYALIGLLTCFLCFPALGKENNINETNSQSTQDHFQWNEHARLSWDDFKGMVNATHDESAAATCCSIGFRTNRATPDSKPEIIVYNIFYTNKSWVRSDAHIQSVLEHEQGHFDLCEIYTRKLKKCMDGIDLNMPGVKQELMRVYSELSNEYEARQQAYEHETIHGTNIAEQKRWQEMIARELI